MQEVATRVIKLHVSGRRGAAASVEAATAAARRAATAAGRAATLATSAKVETLVAFERATRMQRCGAGVTRRKRDESARRGDANGLPQSERWLHSLEVAVSTSARHFSSKICGVNVAVGSERTPPVGASGALHCSGELSAQRRNVSGLKLEQAGELANYVSTRQKRSREQPSRDFSASSFAPRISGRPHAQQTRDAELRVQASEATINGSLSRCDVNAQASRISLEEFASMMYAADPIHPLRARRAVRCTGVPFASLTHYRWCRANLCFYCSRVKVHAGRVECAQQCRRRIENRKRSHHLAAAFNQRASR